MIGKSSESRIGTNLWISQIFCRETNTMLGNRTFEAKLTSGLHGVGQFLIHTQAQSAPFQSGFKAKLFKTL